MRAMIGHAPGTDPIRRRARTASRIRARLLAEYGSTFVEMCSEAHVDTRLELRRQTEPRQRLDLANLPAKPEAGVHVYVCGPGGLINGGTGRRAGWAKVNGH